MGQAQPQRTGRRWARYFVLAVATLVCLVVVAVPLIGEARARLLAAAGYEALGNEDTAAAIAHANAALLIRPELQTARQVLAVAHSRRADHARALEHADVLLSADPNDRIGVDVRADSLAGLGRYEEALPAYERFALVAPELAHPQFRIGRVATRLGRLDRADAAFSLALELANDRQRMLRSVGKVWTTAGHPDRAMPLLDEALALDPNCGHTYYQRGRVWKERDDIERARAEFARAAELLAESLEPRFQLAYCDFVQERFEHARQQYEALTQEYPRDGRVWHNLGMTCWRVGDHAAACSAFAQAAELRPDGPPDLYWVDSLAERGEPERALKMLDRGIAERPDWIEARRDRAQLRLELDDLAGAAADADAVLAAHPEDLVAVLVRVAAWHDAGEWVQSLPRLDAILLRDADQPGVRALRAEALFQVGDSVGARRDMDVVLEVDPDNADMLALRQKLDAETGSE